jgi:DNA primase
MSVIDDIKARLDIVELIGETVKLRKSGRTYTGLCPFHAHKHNTPSFAVWPESGVWKCFGQCNEGGDIFKFVMKRDGVEFSEALRVLAHRAGVELKPLSSEEREQEDNLGHLRQLLEAAAKYYQHLLKNAPQAAHARDHVAKRGLTAKAIELFELGYALDEWDAGLKYFTSKGYSQKDLLDAGLIVEKEDAPVAGQSSPVVRHFDRFRDRLMLPVRDETGRMTGFQARALKPDALPKFMNSPTTALFDKGRTLFGLHLARKSVREAGAAIVVEGNLDVVAAHQAGFSNVVSSQGTALTEHQLRLLKKYSKRIILALDADEAGAAATLRGLTVAREALDRVDDFVFDPRGLVKTEGRLGTDIRVMTLPEGLDPDEVINQNPGEWQVLAEAAEPVVAYVIRVLTTNRDLDDPKVKTQIAETVLPLIEDVGQAIERDTYRQKLARVLKVDERSLVVKRAPPRKTFAPSATSAQVVAESTPNVRLVPREESKLEAYCLAALLQSPELLYKADRQLQDLGLPKLALEDFALTEHQLVFRALTTALEQFDSDMLDHLRENLDPALEPRLAALLHEDADAIANDARTPEHLLNGVLRLRKHTLKEWLNELRFLIEAAREQGDPRAEDYQQEVLQQTRALAQVDQALARRVRRGDSVSHIGTR